MNNREGSPQFDDVKRRLRPGDVFQSTEHDWKSQSDRRWKGSCPWHESSSGTCFSVNPETLEWHCFHCERGGGPLQYVAELEGVGTGARGSLKGKDFFRAWEALARHAGCEAPPDTGIDTSGSGKSSDRRPRRNRNRTRSRKLETVGGSGGALRGTSARVASSEPDLDTSERELREALVRYREALSESEKARAYVEGRGLSVGALRAYGCGFAPAGEWIGQDNAPRLVTPHTTAPRGSSGDGRPRLVNLSGRYLGECPDRKRHRHIGGNPTALFNATAIEGGDGPLVLCEGPLDALSFIEAGWERTAALHNTDGVPWTALRESAETLVFAFDNDDTGREDAVERALAAARRGFDAHTLHDEPAYEGHSDPNEALGAGALSLDYLHGLKGEDMAAGEDNPMHGGDSGESREGREMAAKSSDPEAGRSPQESTDTAAEETPTPADLIPYWNGDNIGFLGKWLWERRGVPDGDVGGGIYADRELHELIKGALEAGPQGTTEQDRIRLRWVLWRLYAAHGPEEVPEGQIPVPPMRRE